MDSKTVSVALKGVTKAVEKHFESKKEEARVRYVLYTTQPLAVGDHSNVVEEAIKSLEDYEHAQSCLDLLSQL